ncbi:ribosomal protein S18-alanine N-acetyltransferase [Clostridium minihomine]|uniref:ribosomal protein S18-alanine N-acetyltransferase n=1 Tax=Clostridium minihomine TaxID=2045012 RepID=UPI000C791B67|nr:ribosomal protein S18-alanine N-acetyltransferase [Clostridium minihomine]
MPEKKVAGNVQIVLMQERHLDALAELERLCFSQPWSREGLAAEQQDSTACFLVAEWEDTVVGYAGMHCVLDEAYVANVAVHPAFRQRGIGILLMQDLERCAKESGAAFLSLEVRASNQAAQALYQSCGFQELGVRKGLYDSPKEDGFILTKTFS